MTQITDIAGFTSTLLASKVRSLNLRASTAEDIRPPRAGHVRIFAFRRETMSHTRKRLGICALLLGLGALALSTGLAAGTEPLKLDYYYLPG